MTLRHMIIFRTLCESEYNTTNAARTLNMTQPAVSLAIKELEHNYGVLLFDRIGHRLKITDAGQLFLQYAIYISDLFNDMETSLRNWHSKGILRIGSSITIGSEFLPQYVKKYSEQYPEIDVRIYVEQSDLLEKRILRNEIDFALIESPPHSTKIISTAYMEDDLCVLCSAQKGWKQGQVISIEEFKKQRFLLRGPGSGTRKVFDRVIEEAGIYIMPAWESMSISTLINAVTIGLGIAVLPHRIIQPLLDNGQIVTVNVEGLDFKRNFYIIYHQDKFLMPSAKNFITICREYDENSE